MTDQNEPSMEDILASIRSILADGEGEPAPVSTAGDKKPEEPVAEPPLPKPAPSPAKAEEPLPPRPSEESVVNLTEDMIVPVQKDEEEDDFTPEPVVKPAAEETQDEAFRDIPRMVRDKIREEDGLLSAPAVEATAASLSHLTQMFASDKNAAVGVPMVTLESIVRELLRPLLKEWLDQNLPDIVERVVRKEIARVTDRLDFK